MDHVEKLEKYYGVSRHKKGWGVTISVEGKSIWLGSFPEENVLEAAKTYDVYRVYYNNKLKDKKNNSKKSRQFPTNELLTTEEILDIETNGIPNNYQRDNIVEINPISELPRGITRRGTKFRVCVQNKGIKYEKVFDRLDDAICKLNKVKAEWNK